MSAGILESDLLSSSTPNTAKDECLANCLWKQVGGIKIGKFTVQPILNNIKMANWQIKVWRISSIRQICQSKVPPNFYLLWYIFLLIQKQPSCKRKVWPYAKWLVWKSCEIYCRWQPRNGCDGIGWWGCIHSLDWTTGLTYFWFLHIFLVGLIGFHWLRGSIVNPDEVRSDMREAVEYIITVFHAPLEAKGAKSWLTIYSSECV